VTAQVDIVNEALQVLGTRTTVTAAQLTAAAANNLAQTCNEAVQTNFIYARTRNRLLRMAPWNCAFNTANLALMTAVFGTPENTSAATNTWQKGQPAPPYAYEYAYPADCLMGAWITPQTATGFAGGIPITTAVTGGAPSFWQGPPVKFRSAIDQVLVVSAAAVANGGTGYVVGDQITVALQPCAAITTNILSTFQVGQPQGAPAVLQVLTAPGGIIGTVALVGPTLNVAGTQQVVTGSYFYANTAVATQRSTTGGGTGATFNLTFSGPQDQRVILTNQEFAILNYVRLVTDENVFDDLFTEAFASVLGARLCMALVGDKQLANMAIAAGNDAIGRARARDGNEGFTVNDVVPSWIRTRGVNYIEDYSGPFNTGFDWGNLWPGYT
jgi:hypothetical protein